MTRAHPRALPTRLADELADDNAGTRCEVIYTHQVVSRSFCDIAVIRALFLSLFIIIIIIRLLK